MIIGPFDIPLVEVLLMMGIVVLIVLIESVIVIGLLMRQMNKTKKVSFAVERLSEAILQVKKAEIEELDVLIQKPEKGIKAKKKINSEKNEKDERNIKDRKKKGSRKEKEK